MGVFTEYFATEHRALQELLDASLQGGTLDPVRVDMFRRRLLQRIAVEEQVLLPALVAKLGRAPLYREALTHDHAGLVALCAPTPQQDWVDGLWEQVEAHHRVEMAEDGFCAQCDAFLGADAEVLLRRAAEVKPVELPSGDTVRARIIELLERTGMKQHVAAPVSAVTPHHTHVGRRSTSIHRKRK